MDRGPISERKNRRRTTKRDSPVSPRGPRKLTLSWVYPLVLSHRCAYRCGYCPLPVGVGPTLPSKSAVERQIAQARSMGLSQMKITGGEGLENHPEIVSTYRFYGFSSFAAYLRALLDQVAGRAAEPPLFPELDLGAVSFFMMQRLRPHLFTLRLFLDSMDSRLQYSAAHAESRGKWPAARLAALVAAGRLGIPVNSGMMVGIGERPESRLRTLEVLAELSDRYGHLQSVTIRPFEPQPRTPMGHYCAPEVEELLGVVSEARRVLPRRVIVQFPIVFAPERVEDFVRAGAGDLGEFELGLDPRANSRTLNAFAIVRDRLDRARIEIVDRLSVFPAFSNADWITERYRQSLRDLSLARVAADPNEPVADSA